LYLGPSGGAIGICRFSLAWDPAFAEPFPPDPHVTIFHATEGNGND